MVPNLEELWRGSEACCKLSVVLRTHFQVSDTSASSQDTLGGDEM